MALVFWRMQFNATVAFLTLLIAICTWGSTVLADDEHELILKHLRIKRSVEATSDEGTTNSANEFFVGYIPNYVQPYIRLLKINGIYLSIVVDGPNSTIVRVTHAGVAKNYQLSPGINNIAVDGVLLDHTNEVPVEGHWDRFKGVHVKAMDSTQISLHGFSEEIHTIEGFTALPCATIPTADVYEYYAVSVPIGIDAIAESTSVSPNSSFLIVACHDNTSVTITPTQSIVNPNHPDRLVAGGESVTIILNRTQTLYTSSPYDLTGSLIAATAPITLLSGHECGNVPQNVSQCDHMVEQIPPTLNWGMEFLLAPTAGREADDVIKIIASEGDTLIDVSCVGSEATLGTTHAQYPITNEGESVSFNKNATHGYCYVLSTKPILVVKFAVGVAADRQIPQKGDPFMVLIPAISQYLNKMVFATAQQFQYSSLSLNHFLNIFVPEDADVFNSSNILLDDDVVTSDWVPIPCDARHPGQVCGHTTSVALSGFQVAHRLSHNRPDGKVSGIVYGLDYRESYAYVAGMMLPVHSADSKPTIMKPIQTSYIILSGHSVCLPCELTQQFDVSPIRWMFKETLIENINDNHLDVTLNGSLCIDNAGPHHTGSYVCLAGSDRLEHTVSVIAGIVIQEPTCYTPKVPHTVTMISIGNGTSYVDADSEAVIICCHVEGDHNSSVWKKNGQALTNGSGYTIHNDYLRIESSSFDYSCVAYTCEATLVGVTAISHESSVVCTGDVQPPRDVRITGKTEITEGDTLNLTCSAGGFPHPKIIWTLGNRTERVVHEQGNSLLIPNLRENDVSSVCCVANNTQGFSMHCEYVTILIPPEIKVPSIASVIVAQDSQLQVPSVQESLPTGNAQVGQTVLILEGYSILIDCQIARGHPKPEVLWTVNDVGITDNNTKHTIFNNGSLLIHTVDTENDEGEYVCYAITPSVGSDNASTQLDVIVPPQIAMPTSSLPLAGSCLDVTSNVTSHEQVGVDLCVKAGRDTQLFLDCKLKRGNPEPIITWLLDGTPISEINGSYTQLSDGTLLIEDILLPGDVLSSGGWDISGLYTCVAVNIAGTTHASSYVFPFGDISEDSIAGYHRSQHLALYHQLHSMISEHVPTLPKGHQHLSLFRVGKMLAYDDYFPGQYFDGSERTISPKVMGKMFDLVDVIPEATSVVSSIEMGQPLTETYTSLVEQIRVSYDDVDSQALTEARNFLQEKIEDFGGEVEGLPSRLMVYFHYKEQYYRVKLEVETAKDRQQKRLSSRSYATWVERNAFTLDGRVNDSYTKWEVFGNRTEVEKKLSKLNLQDRSAPLENAQALLEATRRNQKGLTFYPVKFTPEKWYELLDNRIEESIQQFQYRISKLKAQRQVLVITKEYLEDEIEQSTACNKLTFNIPLPLACPLNTQTDPNSESIFSKLDSLKYELEEFVTQSEKSRYQCLITRSPEDCHIYTTDNDIVASLMNVYAELYFEVKFVETALNHQDFTLPAISSTIALLNRQIDSLESFVHLTLISSFPPVDTYEESYPPEIRTNAIGVTEFKYSSISVRSQHHNYAFSLPNSIKNRLLWHLDITGTTFVSEELLQEYKDTINHMNSVNTNITATVKKVDVQRKWFKPTLFTHSYFVLTNQSVLVSPGRMSSPTNFRDTLTNQSFQLPLYPSSLLLATDIKLHIETPFPFYSLPTLLKMSSDDHIRGGFGPFRFGHVFRSKMGKIKFRVEVHHDNLVITIPGTQTIGFLCDIVPNFPVEAKTVRYRKSASTFEKEDAKNTNLLAKWLMSRKDQGQETSNSQTMDTHAAMHERKNEFHVGVEPTSTLLHMYTNTNVTSHMQVHP